MKDSLFEILLNLFEKTLTQLKKDALNADEVSKEDGLSPADETGNNLIIKAQHSDSMRVFTPEEQLKLSKASYQFLMRLCAWEILVPESLELVINQLLFSDSSFIDLRETKWTVRNTLAESLTNEQLAFLDLVLYPNESSSLH